MGVSTLEVSYTSATTGRGDYEVHKGHVVALEKKKFYMLGFVLFCCYEGMLFPGAPAARGTTVIT
jgi:hypothetical protein